MAFLARLFFVIGALALLVDAQENKPTSSAASGDVAQAIEAVNRELDAAEQRRDRSAANRRTASEFILIHPGGAFDNRSVFLDRIAGGTLRAGQADDVAEFDVSITTYGETAIRRSRVRRRVVSQQRELWILEIRVFVRQNDNWLLASVQGSRLYDGPIIDPRKHERLAGTYVSDSGRKLTVVSSGYGFFVHWPVGTTSQVFPVSDADAADELRRLHFTFDATGKAIAAAEFRHRPLPPPVTGTEGRWRGRRVNNE